MLPPTLHCDDPHPDLADTRFRRSPGAAVDRTAGRGRAAVNAFGFGGINAHAILEQPPDAPAAPRTLVVREPVRCCGWPPTPREELLGHLDAGAERTDGRCRLAVVEPTPKKLTPPAGRSRRSAVAGPQRHLVQPSPAPSVPSSAPVTLRLEPGALVRRQVTASVAADAPPTAPYFHLSASNPALYDWSAAPPAVRGEPSGAPELTGTFLIDGAARSEREVTLRINDQARGEVGRPVIVACRAWRWPSTQPWWSGPPETACLAGLP